MDLTPEQMASVVHEMNRQFRLVLGQAPGPHWNEADDQLKAVSVNGVKQALAGVTSEQLHQTWVDFKRSQGWIWGPHKDVPNRRHPCMVPYEHLPEHEKVKDHMFNAVVEVMKAVTL